MTDKWGRNFLGTPPQGRADYAFIQHILSSMNEGTGRCAILLPHGVLNRMEEDEMRMNLVKKDLIDCVISIGKNLFFNSPMEACIMLCRSNKPSERQGRVLFIRATDLVERKDGESYLTEAHIKEITSLYHAYDNIDNRSCVVNIESISQNEYSISPKLYVKRIGNDSDIIDFEEGIKMWENSSVLMHAELEKLLNIL